MPELTPTWAALKAITDRLMHLRGQMAELDMARIERKAVAIDMSDATSATGRKQDSDRAVMDLDREVAKVKGEILRAEDFRQLLVLAVTHEVEVVDVGA